MADSPAHVRIDEGVKRGPRHPRKPGTRLAPLKLIPGIEYHPSKLTGVKPLDLITRYLNGETSEQIAHSLKVTRQGLAYFLRKTAEEDWREAQIIQAIERKELAEELLNTASDPLSLARAREQLRAAQWDLERLFRRVYGESVQVEHVNAAPALNITVVQSPQIAPQHGQSEPIDVTPSTQAIDNK